MPNGPVKNGYLFDKAISEDELPVNILTYIRKVHKRLAFQIESPLVALSKRPIINQTAEQVYHLIISTVPFQLQ